MTTPHRQRFSRDTLEAYLTSRIAELEAVVATYKDGIRAAATVERQKEYRAWAVIAEAKIGELKKLGKAMGVEG